MTFRGINISYLSFKVIFSKSVLPNDYAKVNLTDNANKKIKTKFCLCSFNICTTYAWKCVLTVISNDVEFPDVNWCHLLRQMSLQWRSQKSLHKLWSHELTDYLSDFCLFFDSMKWSFYQTSVNQITLNNLSL